jgi:hypothetical protein
LVRGVRPPQLAASSFSDASADNRPAPVAFAGETEPSSAGTRTSSSRGRALEQTGRIGNSK